MIKCLPEEVQGKLRSGVSIPSLQQCVEELLLNSIDAGATCVGVRVDMTAFKVQVIDNGVGMSSEDMESVGSRYHTSKCSSVEDLEHLSWYGFRGEALASVVSLSTLVEISSRTKSSVKTHVKVFKGGKDMGVFEADTTRPSAGTTVVVCNFFHNMPVRRKRMDPVLEGERIRQRVEAVSLMHPSVSFTLKNDCTGAMMVQLPKARNTYHRFVQIHSLSRAQKLGEVSHTHNQFQVTGHIGREGHYNNTLQFLYVNERLLLKTRIHKLLNFLLRRLSSANQKSDSPEGSSVTRSPKIKRSQELHGVYVINIKCPYSEYDICLEPAKTLIEFKDWDGILLCVEEAVKAFLSRENLVAVLSQDDVDSVSPKFFFTHNTDQEEDNRGSSDQAAGSASTLECSIGVKLSSHSVHRRRRDVEDEGKGDSEERREQNMDANELVKAKSEGSVEKDCGGEPQSDPPLVSASGSITNEVEESTSSEMVEDAQIVCTNLERQLDSEISECLQEIETELNKTLHTRKVTLLDSICQQTQPALNNNLQVLPGESSTSNRKVSLSDPYIHEIFHTQKCSQTVVEPQILGQTQGQRSFASKRKISLNALHDGENQKQCSDFAPVIPLKIPRVGQKLSLCKEPGSLEKFRRLYGKADNMKLPRQEVCNPSLPQTVLTPQTSTVCQKPEREGAVAEKAEMPSSPPTLSLFTNIKPVPAQDGNSKSLAAKLCRLKTHNSKASPRPSRSLLRHDAAPRGGGGGGGSDDIQDSNNNPCDPEPEPPGPESQEDTASGDWIQHYDASVGKTAYINRVTGLSRYDDPALEDREAPCTSDVTNLAVSVVSEMGLEYRCYPFQVDQVLPFLPKSRTERVISSGLDDRDDTSENSLTSLYSKWSNPVFVRPPMVAVDISSGQADGLAVKIHNILFPYRFSKAMIRSMKVIHQVDKKFLACLINTRDEEEAEQTETEGNLLVLVDQHAAHERVRLENLVEDSYEDDPDAPGERRLSSSNILPPLEISVTEEELRLLRSCEPRLRSLGLEVEFSEAADPRVFIGKVPLCFMEKESNELRRGRPSVIKPVVEEYLREQIELLRSTGTVRGTLPLTVLKVLASLACHGAIKFNDSLSRDECRSLVASLSSCHLPFQCAHGRPSIAPLVDVLHLDKDQKDVQKPNLQKLRRMCKAWKLFGNG